MFWQGNYTEDATLDFAFHTTDASNVPTTLGGTPVISVYKGNSDVPTVTGVTLTPDFDGVTGLNHVRIDTSADAFYAVANDYHVIITTGTVDGISVVGATVGTFSIEHRKVVFIGVTITTQQRVGPTTWYFEWTSDATPPVTYYIYIDGVLVETTTRASRFVQAVGGTVAFEVLDDTSAPKEVHPGQLLITIQTDAEGAQYKVDQYVDAAWSTIRTFLAVGDSYFSHQTPTLADDTVHLFRVVPVIEAGIDGTPKQISAHIVRVPDAPNVAYTRNTGTGVVTVSDAA